MPACFALGLVLLALFSPSSVCAANDFVAATFFEGQWRLEAQSSSASGNFVQGVIYDERLSLVKGDEGGISGLYVNADEDQLGVLVECYDDYGGVFSMESSADEGEYFEAFAFSFTNRSNGMLASQGSWNDADSGEKGYYQFTVTSVNTFVMNVFVFNSEGHIAEVRTTTASKFIKKDSQSWWQRWSMPLMLLVVVFVSQMMKQPARQAARTAPQTASAPPGGGRTGPVIEEVSGDAPAASKTSNADKLD